MPCLQARVTAFDRLHTYKTISSSQSSHPFTTSERKSINLQTPQVDYWRQSKYVTHHRYRTRSCRIEGELRQASSYTTPTIIVSEKSLPNVSLQTLIPSFLTTGAQGVWAGSAYMQQNYVQIYRICGKNGVRWKAYRMSLRKHLRRRTCGTGQPHEYFSSVQSQCQSVVLKLGIRKHVSFEVITAANIRSDTTTCSLVNRYQCLRGTCFIYLHGSLWGS